MSIFIIIILILALGAGIWYIFDLRKRMKETEARLVKKHQTEIAATQSLFETQQEQKEFDYKQQLQDMEENYYGQINELNRSIDALQQHVIDLQMYSRNSGEIETHQILEGLKQQLIKEGKLTSSEMFILPNLFIPYTTETGLMKTRQIDHLILLPAGLFIVETKFWRGKIIHGLNRNNAGMFSFINDMMGSKDSHEDQTLVFVETKNNDEPDTPMVQIKSYGDPAKQAKRSAQILSQYLLERLEHKMYATPIVYFGYESVKDEAYNQGVLDLSNDGDSYRFTNKKDLCGFIRNQLNHAPIYSEDDLQVIRDTLKHINYVR
ncbi:nuclease-related domain-containing protein [Scopulibacillus cellulosilyticus]|uniref:Nuclease-related domain-containing protein n=1 Tax=Scopulibacillus cellulosilyticus TaxID=2665665 RepID=A0ABW2PY85_9BACL